MDPYKVIKYPLSTEKSIRLMESENKLVFVIDLDATKLDVKAAVEKVLKVKVDDVKTFINKDGKKRAFVKLNPENPAIDVAAQLGLM
jgi:ribosomal protein L23